MSALDPDFTGYRAVAAEGARVGFITCKKCGAGLLLDPKDTFDATALHREWHDRHDADQGGTP